MTSRHYKTVLRRFPKGNREWDAEVELVGRTLDLAMRLFLESDPSGLWARWKIPESELTELGAALNAPVDPTRFDYYLQVDQPRDTTLLLPLVAPGCAAVAGASYALMVYEIPRWINDVSTALSPAVSFGATMLAALVIMSLLMLPIAATARESIWALSGFIVLGICIGVIVDVSRDSVERNLVPFEIVLLTCEAVPGILLGGTIGRRLRRRRRIRV